MGFSSCEVSSSTKDTEIFDLVNVNKSIRKLKSQQILLQFLNYICLEECTIIYFADAAFPNLKN